LIIVARLKKGVVYLTSKKLVSKTIKGENNTGVTPVYGWVSANLDAEISAQFGSVANFEDHYKFDAAHLFGGPPMYNYTILEKLRAEEGELTPEMMLNVPFLSPDDMSQYKSVQDALEFYSKQRERFCYIQSNGIFEHNNGVFGIEDHLCYLALYPNELKELYSRQAKWNAIVANNMIDLGVDMIHVSDDWGAQRGLMFSPTVLNELIIPNHKPTADVAKKRGVFLSLHSDGCVIDAIDGIVELGYNLVHPWQECAGMPYSLYLAKYADKLAILGGLCIQSTLGFGDYERLESEIRRVFSLLGGKRFICCTTHFVQNHCTMDELTFAFDLVTKLANKNI
jgi:uroporphyrinogen decarboxylase